MKKIFFYLVFLGIPSNMVSQKIKSITEFKKDGDNLLKTKFSLFDNNGNLTSEIIYGSYDKRLETFRNIKKNIVFEKGLKIEELICDYFVKQDTCVIRTRKKFNYNPKTKMEIVTMFETDSSIRFIKQIYKTRRIEVVKTFSWEIFPTKIPDYENASVFIDSIFYDKKGREIKNITHSGKDSYIKIQKYSNKQVSIYQKFNMQSETVTRLEYPRMQRMIDRKKMDYQFRDTKKYDYKIEYF